VEQQGAPKLVLLPLFRNIRFSIFVQSQKFQL
jgi:hypothetical protein